MYQELYDLIFEGLMNGNFESYYDDLESRIRFRWAKYDGNFDSKMELVRKKYAKGSDKKWHASWDNAHFSYEKFKTSPLSKALE